MFSGIFCRIRRLAWCNDPESYVGGSVATGRATLAGQVKGEHPDKERYTGPPGWGWVDGPAPYHPGEKNTHAKIPRPRLETKEDTRKTEEKLDGRYKEGHEGKKPK